MQTVKLVVLVFLLALPVLLSLVKVPIPASCPGSGNVVVEKVTSVLSTIHCKGAEFNVSVTLRNNGSTPFEGFVSIDGWDRVLNTHVTGALFRVRLEPGGRVTIWEMLPIDTQEPDPSRYFFNATVLGGPASAGSCGEQSVPLYLYILLKLRG